MEYSQRPVFFPDTVMLLKIPVWVHSRRYSFSQRVATMRRELNYKYTQNTAAPPGTCKTLPGNIESCFFTMYTYFDPAKSRLNFNPNRRNMKKNAGET